MDYYNETISRKMSKKFTIFRLSVYLIVFRMHFTAAQVKLDICADADLGSECRLTCTTPDNLQTISFFKLPNVLTGQGACLASGGGCFVSDNTKYNIIQNGSVTQLIIISHTQSEKGMWRCDYGGTSNDKELNWAKLPTTILTSTGISANTVVKTSSILPVTVRVGCLYSENAPTVKIQYLPGTDSSVMTCAKSATVCSDPDLSAYDCSKTITSGSAKCGDTVYTMQLKVSVSNTRNTFQQQIFSPYTIKFECDDNSDACKGDDNSDACKDWPPIITAIIIILVIVIVVLLLSYCFYKKGQQQRRYIYALQLIQLILVVIVIVLVLVLFYYRCCEYSREIVLPSVIVPCCVIVILEICIVKIKCGPYTDVEEEETATVTRHQNTVIQQISQGTKQQVSQEAVMDENTTLLEDILLAFKHLICSVTWSFLGKEIPVKNDNKYLGGKIDSPGLTITDLKANDAGTYKCIILIKEKTNTIQKEFEVELIIIVSQEGSKGESITLLKDISSFLGHPIHSVAWSFDGNEIQVQSDKRYDGGHSKFPGLTISGLTENDSGSYTCIILLEDTTCPVQKKFGVELKIKVSQEGSKGESITLLKDISSFLGHPIHSVAWTFDGNEIQLQSDKRYDGGHSKSPGLTITGLTENDAGSYTCIILLKDKTCPVQKKFGVELKIKVCQEAFKGECITLLKDMSSFLGHPIHSVAWSFHGNEIQVQSDKRYDGGQIESPGLTITGLAENDAGSYTCTILLKDKTSTVQKKFGVELKIKVQHETTVGLTFTLLKDLKVKKAESVTWFFHEKKLHVNSDDRYQGGTNASHALVITDLKDSDAGTYKCTIAQKDKENIWERHYLIQLNIKAKPKELRKRDVPELNNGTTDS